jgi:death-on-curing protein
MVDDGDSITYLTVEDILALHELVVESNPDTEPGVSAPGDIEYAVSSIKSEPFGRSAGSLHEQVFHLVRLLVANHPFVDGNKRTALMSARVFYALNGVKFDYDRSIKETLKELATDEQSVSEGDVVESFRQQTEPLADEYRLTIELWLDRIQDSSNDSAGILFDRDEPNDYDEPDTSN